MNKLLLILVLCIALPIHAEERKFVSAYIYSYPQTGVEGVTAPVKWEMTDWLTAAGIVGVEVGLYLYDEKINHLILENRSDLSQDVCLVAKQFGNGNYIMPAIGATVLGGYLCGSDKTIDTGLLCLKSFLLANGVTISMKLATQRQRPFKENGKEFWNGRGFKFGRDSFPSGHSTVVWSVAPVLAGQYKEQIWVTPLVYGIAGLTSYSRMHDNKHWASDVFAGAVIGYVTAELTLKTTPGLAIYPDVASQGVSVNWHF
jgi:membrane-associated phospholipid phosphatase